ncbi:MAG: ABC transporter substrate-binding protein [Gammaproteobacteria bacterium]
MKIWLAALALTCCVFVSAQDTAHATLYDAARGQTVYFNAWGGDPSINRYIEWVALRVREDHDITLKHVKVGDIAEAVLRIRAEKTAGRNTDGSVDLLWINGENFAALKRANLLHGPWALDAPGAHRINWASQTIARDGNLDTDGYEMPWGSSALTFFYDSDQVSPVPRTPEALLIAIEQTPGRFSYPQPPAFVGTAFLKQMLVALVTDPARLQQPVAEDFAAVTQPLWTWLDRAHVSMWRRGRLFPRSGPAQRDLVALGELDWMLSYNPSEASRAMGQGELHGSMRGVQLRDGALANSHFVAIPFNSGAKEAAMVVGAFLISIEAQARKADERHWGDTTVLDVSRLTAAEQRVFDRAARGIATPPPTTPQISEPHPSWNDALERAWLERYTR